MAELLERHLFSGLKIISREHQLQVLQLCKLLTLPPEPFEVGEG